VLVRLTFANSSDLAMAAEADLSRRSSAKAEAFILFTRSKFIILILQVDSGTKAQKPASHEPIFFYNTKPA